MKNNNYKILTPHKSLRSLVPSKRKSDRNLDYTPNTILLQNKRLT
jgi:hypothetical protein